MRSWVLLAQPTSPYQLVCAAPHYTAEPLEQPPCLWRSEKEIIQLSCNGSPAFPSCEQEETFLRPQRAIKVCPVLSDLQGWVSSGLGEPHGHRQAAGAGHRAAWDVLFKRCQETSPGSEVGVRSIGMRWKGTHVSQDPHHHGSENPLIKSKTFLKNTNCPEGISILNHFLGKINSY